MKNDELNKQLLRQIEIRNDKVDIYLVNGTYIRDSLFQDWTQGGHKHVNENYNFIPDKEIWIDSNLNEKDREATILHEATEYELMKFKNIDYDTAHDISNKEEKKFRNKKTGQQQYPDIDLVISEGEGTGKTIKDIADKYNANIADVIEQVKIGMGLEVEHSDNKDIQQKTAMNHIWELGLSYYPELINMEEKLKNDNNSGDLFSKEIKALYTKKPVKSTKEQIIEVLKKATLETKDIEILKHWEGEGSVKERDTKTGVLHEFFTPYWLCKAIGEIVKSLNIKNPKVLDPACGTGRLISFVKYETFIGFEVNKFNADITKALYYGSDTIIYKQAFETAFLQPTRYTKAIKGKSWIGNDFDLVISNPPYGEYAGEYSGFMPKVFTRFEFLFVALSMTVVKPGGYGIFVLPQSFMNNGNMYNKQKEEIMGMCNFIDAVRLPNGIFASTDIGVDILILQKK